VEKKKIKLGFAPTRRREFPAGDSVLQKELIKDKLRAWGVEYVDIEWLNLEGLLYEELDALQVVRKFRDEGVDALFVPHCNFGTEAAVGALAREIHKPLLLWGPRDEAPLPNGMRLRDTQCGLFATSKVLRRLGLPFTYIVNSRLDDPLFERGFKAFLGVVAAVRAFLGARIGQVSTRPADFWTVMANEGELLERWGIRVVPTTLVDIQIGVEKYLEENPPILSETVEDLNSRVTFVGIDEEEIRKTAALKLTLLDWARAAKLDAIAIQCWTALQKALGVASCFVDGELSAHGIPAACETDIHGALTSVMLQAAGLWSSPTFFADWTIRHPEDDNAELLWHCGPFPVELADSPKPEVGIHQTMGGEPPCAGHFRIKGGDITLARFDGDHGEYSLLMGEGKGTTGPSTWGTYLWAEFKNWPKWEEKIIYGPYIHHVVGVHGRFAPILYEACKYIPGLTPDPVEPTAEEIAAYWRGEDS